LTLFGPSSRISLAIFLAFSAELPSLRVTAILETLAGLAQFAGAEDLQRQLPLDQPVLEHAEHGARAVLRRCGPFASDAPEPGSAADGVLGADGETELPFQRRLMAAPPAAIAEQIRRKCVRSL
jgi:hypothetical protein